MFQTGDMISLQTNGPDQHRMHARIIRVIRTNDGDQIEAELDRFTSISFTQTASYKLTPGNGLVDIMPDAVELVWNLLNEPNQVDMRHRTRELLYYLDQRLEIFRRKAVVENKPVWKVIDPNNRGEYASVLALTGGKDIHRKEILGSEIPDEFREVFNNCMDLPVYGNQLVNAWRLYRSQTVLHEFSGYRIQFSNLC